MDGWESRRRRTEGHDWCIIKLGLPGNIRTIEVDTAFFTGNYSPKISIQATHIEENNTANNEILNKLEYVRKESRKQNLVENEGNTRMGLCATREEFDLVSMLKSEQWDFLVPLSPLAAGYEATRKKNMKVCILVKKKYKSMHTCDKV
jgi:allantoicase